MKYFRNAEYDALFLKVSKASLSLEYVPEVEAFYLSLQDQEFYEEAKYACQRLLSLMYWYNKEFERAYAIDSIHLSYGPDDSFSYDVLIDFAAKNSSELHRQPEMLPYVIPYLKRLSNTSSALPVYKWYLYEYPDGEDGSFEAFEIPLAAIVKKIDLEVDMSRSFAERVHFIYDAMHTAAHHMDKLYKNTKGKTAADRRKITLRFIKKEPVGWYKDYMMSGLKQYEETLRIAEHQDKYADLKIKTIIFDLDGTIADTLPLCIAAFKKSIEPLLGSELTNQEITATFGPSEEGTIRKLIPEHEAVGVKSYLEHYKALHDMCPKPFDHIENTLEHFKLKGVNLAMVTGKGLQSAKISLEQFGLTEFFTVLEAGNPEGPDKANGIKRAMARLNADPAECIYIGDTPADILAARAAGILILSAAWAKTTDDKELLLLDPDWICYSVSALWSCIGHYIPTENQNIKTTN